MCLSTLKGNIQLLVFAIMNFERCEYDLVIHSSPYFEDCIEIIKKILSIPKLYKAVLGRIWGYVGLFFHL